MAVIRVSKPRINNKLNTPVLTIQMKSNQNCKTQQRETMQFKLN